MKKILCIPRIESEIRDDDILKTLNTFNIGEIEKLISIPHKNNEKYKRIILHINIDEHANIYKKMCERFTENKPIILHINPVVLWKLIEAGNPQKPKRENHSIVQQITL